MERDSHFYKMLDIIFVFLYLKKDSVKEKDKLNI